MSLFFSYVSYSFLSMENLTSSLVVFSMDLLVLTITFSKSFISNFFDLISLVWSTPSKGLLHVGQMLPSVSCLIWSSHFLIL